MDLAVIYSQYTTSTIGQAMGVTSNNQKSKCYAYIEQYIPDILGRYYLDRLYKNNYDLELKRLIDSVKEAFKQLLEANTWMTDTTKANAIKKLNAITDHVTFPEYTKDDTQLINFDKPVVLKYSILIGI